MQNLLFTCLWYFLCVTAVSQQEIWFPRSFTANRRRIWGFRRRWWMGRGRRYMSTSPLQFFSMPKRSSAPTLQHSTNAPMHHQHSNTPKTLQRSHSKNPPTLHQRSSAPTVNTPKLQNAQMLRKRKLWPKLGSARESASLTAICRLGSFSGLVKTDFNQIESNHWQHCL